MTESDSRDVDAGSSSSRRTPWLLQQQNKHDLFQLLLPSDHERVLKGRSGVWEKHFQSQHHHHHYQQPTRPQTGRKQPSGAGGAAGGIPGHLPVSPRSLISAAAAGSSPRQQHGASLGSTPRCKSAGVAGLSSSRRLPLESASEQQLHDHRSSFKRPLASPRTHSEAPRPASACELAAAVSSEEVARQSSERGPRVEDPYAAIDAVLEVNAHAREHVEVKACMLAYMHRIDVDELKQLKEQAQQEIGRVKLQHFVTQSGIAGDGSEFDAMRRKTSFLLRHFFSLDDGRVR